MLLPSISLWNQTPERSREFLFCRMITLSNLKISGRLLTLGIIGVLLTNS